MPKYKVTIKRHEIHYYETYIEAKNAQKAWEEQERLSLEGDLYGDDDCIEREVTEEYIYPITEKDKIEEVK